MDQLEKKTYFNNLYDYYGKLLTNKQQEVFEAYYFNDLSLQEIAIELDITRSAVFDTLSKVEKALENYESILGLDKKNKQLDKLIDELNNHVDNEGKEILKNIKEME